MHTVHTTFNVRKQRWIVQIRDAQHRRVASHSTLTPSAASQWVREWEQEHKMRLVHLKRAGFTIIELMIGLAIIGILATLAIPTFHHFKTRAQYSEATNIMGGLFKAQASAWYRLSNEGSFDVAHGGDTGTHQSCFAPSRADLGHITFHMPDGGKKRAPTMSPGCDALDFNIADPIAFTYVSLPNVHSYQYLNWAIEDLDGDGDLGYIAVGVKEKDGQLMRGCLTRTGDIGSGDQIPGKNFVDVVGHSISECM